MVADGRPEELVNHYAKSLVAASNIATAVGFIAFLWSTVVLLGGFVSILPIKDFWFLSLLSFLMASQVVLEMNIRTAWDHVAEIPILSLSMANPSQHWTGFFVMIIVSTGLIVKIIVAICIALPIFWLGSGPALGLALARLIQGDYGDAGGDAANKAKLNAALIIFYVLVIIHSLFFFYWAFLTILLPRMSVSNELGFEIWGPQIVRKYWRGTIAKYRKDGMLPNNWNLTTFSVGLLESAYPEDRLCGTRVLDTFIATPVAIPICPLKRKKDIRIRQKLLSSSQAIQNLMYMIGLTSTDDCEIRERAARIVADLASELRITQFPDAMRCICCLLESCNQHNGPKDASGVFPERRVWIEQVVIDWVRYYLDIFDYYYVCKGTKELVFQGLVILERLTQDEDNCVEVIKHQRLLSKIALPLSYHDFLSNGCDHRWVQIHGRLLTVVSRLISVRLGEDSTKLRHDISCNTVAIGNLMRILKVDSEGARELRGQAIEILTGLAFDDSFRKLAFDESTSMVEMFVKMLRDIFLKDRDNDAIVANKDEEKDKRVRTKAGEALARLLRVPSARDNTGAFTSATNLYDIYLLPKQDVINLLTRVFDHILSCKAKQDTDVVTQSAASYSCHAKSQPPNGADTRQSSTQETEEQSKDRKMLAAVLSLTVAICNKNVISGDDFIRAIPDDATFVKKLKMIVEMDEVATTDGLRIQKLACQVVIAMVLLKPSYTREFNEHNLKEALSKALETMSDVDNGMLFADDDREVPARSLNSLVKEAQLLLAQEQDAISA